MMGIEKKTYSVKLNEEFVMRMKYFADKQNRSLSNFVETILKEKMAILEREEAEEQGK